MTRPGNRENERTTQEIHTAGGCEAINRLSPCTSFAEYGRSCVLATQRGGLLNLQVDRFFFSRGFKSPRFFPNLPPCRSCKPLDIKPRNLGVPGFPIFWKFLSHRNNCRLRCYTHTYTHTHAHTTYYFQLKNIPNSSRELLSRKSIKLA